MLKFRYNRGEPADLYFWRDSSGNEVDVVVERGAKLHALEVKARRTVAADYLQGLERFVRIAQDGSATLVYAGDQGQERNAATIFGWRGIASAMKRVLGAVSRPARALKA